MEELKSFIIKWCNKKYDGSKELGDWTTEEVMEFANDFAKELIKSNNDPIDDKLNFLKQSYATRTQILNELFFDDSDERNRLIVSIAMKRYAQIKCGEQRELCAKEYTSYYAESEEDFSNLGIYDSILNAPEPKFE